VQKEMRRVFILVTQGRFSGLSEGTDRAVPQLISRYLSLVDFRLFEGGATACDK
jgi:hypothetical protein